MLSAYHPDPHDELLWESDLVRFGRFRAAPEESDFAVAGEIRSAPTLVFPRTIVGIAQAGWEPFVSDPMHAVMYNLGQPYRRSSATGEEDRCEWFHFAPEVMSEVLTEIDPTREDDPDSPFRSPRVAIDADIYGSQRLVVRHVAEAGAPDPLLVEETLLWVLRESLARQADVASHRGAGAGRRWTEAAREVLAERYEESASLHDIAEAIGCSPFHLCRVFRAETGSTLHRYRLRLRLSVALDRIAEPSSDLSAIAFDLGFASHSHFTAHFRRTFGFTPSEFRRRASRIRVHRLRERLLSRHNGAHSGQPREHRETRAAAPDEHTPYTSYPV